MKPKRLVKITVSAELIAQIFVEGYSPPSCRLTGGVPKGAALRSIKKCENNVWAFYFEHPTFELGTTDLTPTIIKVSPSEDDSLEALYE